MKVCYQAAFAASQRFAVEDRRRSWRHFATTLAALAVALSLALSPLAIPLRAMSGVLMGLVLVRLFIIYHDYQHGAIFRDSRLARWLLTAFGVLILTPPRVWNRLHNYHHSKNSQLAFSGIGSFPVMAIHEYLCAPRKVRLAYRVYRSPFTILFGYVGIFVVGICLRYFLREPRRHIDSLLALVLHAVLIGVLGSVCGWPTLVFAYLLPLFVALTLGAYLFYAQHNYPGVKLRAREDWDFGYAALHSSSYMEGGPILHWFTGNIGYHHVHHLNHRIPFYRLPEAMAAIPALKSPGRTSLHPIDIYRCLRLKLWDPEKGRMVGFAEARSQQLAMAHTLRGSD